LAGGNTDKSKQRTNKAKKDVSTARESNPEPRAQRPDSLPVGLKHTLHERWCKSWCFDMAISAHLAVGSPLPSPAVPACLGAHSKHGRQPCICDTQQQQQSTFMVRQHFRMRSERPQPGCPSGRLCSLVARCRACAPGLIRPNCTSLCVCSNAHFGTAPIALGRQ